MGRAAYEAAGAGTCASSTNRNQSPRVQRTVIHHELRDREKEARGGGLCTRCDSLCGGACPTSPSPRSIACLTPYLRFRLLAVCSQDDLSSEFVFHNPNAEASCGCGESFTTGNSR